MIAKDIMSKDIHYCFETDDVEAVTKHMEKLQVQHLVVVNKDKQITGTISIGDIGKAKNLKLDVELADTVGKD